MYGPAGPAIAETPADAIRQIGAVIQPMTLAVLTAAVTMPTANAMRALRWMN